MNMAIIFAFVFQANSLGKIQRALFIRLLSLGFIAADNWLNTSPIVKLSQRLC